MLVFKTTSWITPTISPQMSKSVPGSAFKRTYVAAIFWVSPGHGYCVKQCRSNHMETTGDSGKLGVYFRAQIEWLGEYFCPNTLLIPHCHVCHRPEDSFPVIIIAIHVDPQGNTDRHHTCGHITAGDFNLKGYPQRGYATSFSISH